MRTRNRGAIWRKLTLALLIGVAAVVVLFSARGLMGVSQYTTGQVVELRRELAAVPNLPREKRLELETALTAYETDSRIKIWTAIIQAAGGAALLLGLVFTARKLDIDRQGQLTTRFIEATGQLGAELKDGKPNVEVRLGGIYALNRISNDWPKDYWPIADILTAYVRYNAPWKKEPNKEPNKESNEQRSSTDIQAILTVLGENAPPGGFNDRNKLDLRRTDLRGLEFYDARLEWTDFYGAHLERAEMWGAVLRHAKLDHAHLGGANLRKAKLDGASVVGADFKGALYDGETVWPKGFDVAACGVIRAD